GAAVGAIAGQDWVAIPGSSVEIMKYEASRPDARATTDGTQTTHVCSRAGVKPWTSVTYPQAVAACSAVGARLCAESEWERMCSPAPIYPLAGPTGTTDFVYIEAEDALARVAGSGDSWTNAATQDFAGATAVQALANNGTIVSLANALTSAPRLDFQLALTATGTYHVWVRMMGLSTNDDTVHVGLRAGAAGAAIQTLTVAATNRWIWVRTAATITVAATGNHTASVYMAEDGVRVDAIAVTRATATTLPFDERTWAYATDVKTPQDATCNGDPFDTDGAVAGDQDGILATGSLAMCFANGAGTADAFDMSGNVKEWTLARAVGQNPLRGGASNNETSGLTCGLDFTLADNAFFFPNVGFRCCRD
ncbi:MAG: hypothetical protein H0X17_15265, partial [Deltaproteobacteria bacterium]|nr:hypothetical protein [Deltaproteobacteria bacterium]